MINIRLNTDYISDLIKTNEYDKSLDLLRNCNVLLKGKTGKGNEFLGWLDLPAKTTITQIEYLNKTAKELAGISEIFVVIGIGGSYLGARAVISALGSNFQGLDKSNSPQVVYAGNNISEDYLYELIGILDSKEYSIAVISKSGTTTEPAIAFRILKNHIEKKYGKKEAARRIVAITDASRGALKQIALKEGYRTFIIPDDVGGRFSVLTAVGLLPVAVAGYDIHSLLKGAADMMNYLTAKDSATDHIAIQYAAIRHLLYSMGKTTEILVNYNPKLYYFSEWWKQLFGESEGKENKGIFPASANFTTDLHSLGQYIQDGLRNLFETVIAVENSNYSLEVPFSDDDGDDLNYIAGKKLEKVNNKALLGTLMAHAEGNVPNLLITVPEISEYVLGQMIYFFEYSCALSGYALEINPFDQPGVEAYKRNMFKLLGKPGF